VFIVVSIYFVIDSDWKLLDTPSYNMWMDRNTTSPHFMQTMNKYSEICLRPHTNNYPIQIM